MDTRPRREGRCIAKRTEGEGKPDAPLFPTVTGSVNDRLATELHAGRTPGPWTTARLPPWILSIEEVYFWTCEASQAAWENSMFALRRRKPKGRGAGQGCLSLSASPCLLLLHRRHCRWGLRPTSRTR